MLYCDDWKGWIWGGGFRGFQGVVPPPPMILNSPIHLHTRPTSCHSMVSSNCVVPRANYTVAEIAGMGNYMYKEVKTAILQ